MSAISPQTYSQILDNLPQLVMRLVYRDSDWIVTYVNKAVERYGYKHEGFANGKRTWNTMIHPDDRVATLKLSGDYLENNIDDFKLQYRLLGRDGGGIYITEYSHVNRAPDGSPESVDSFVFENVEVHAVTAPGGDIAAQRHLALNDILLTINDARSEPEKALQAILKRSGVLLDCSRALLFRDSDDHKACKVVYEWCNSGIASIKEQNYASTYATEMPEVHAALQEKGFFLMNAGEIPENCATEFGALGLLATAVFAIYQYGDRYGFVCFDDCIIERHWDVDTVNFLKVVANLLSNVIMNLESARYMKEYEEKIKSLAFRDYFTGLPNRYPFDSDFADAILAAGASGMHGYAVMIGLHDVDAIRNAHGIKIINKVCLAIAEELQAVLKHTVGNRGALYRISGTIFAVLAQPGPAEPVRAFVEQVAARGRSPWRIDTGEFSCGLNVAAVPFGVKNNDPEMIFDRLDAATVESCSRPGNPPVFKDGEC